MVDGASEVVVMTDELAVSVCCCRLREKALLAAINRGTELEAIVG